MRAKMNKKYFASPAVGVFCQLQPLRDLRGAGHGQLKHYQRHNGPEG